MDDYYEAIRQGDTFVRLSIWETNMGPDFGYVKWQVDRREDEFWVHCSDPVITTFDVAVRDGRSMMQHIFDVWRGM